MAIHKAAVVLALAFSSAHYVLANPIVARDTSTSASATQPPAPGPPVTSSSAAVSSAPTPSNCANGVQVGDGTASCWTDLGTHDPSVAVNIGIEMLIFVEGLEDYINNWWSSNSGKCNGQGFAQCWYQLQTPYSPTTCDAINGGTSCTTPKWEDFPSTSANSAENFFVTWTVYNTYTLFQNLYTSINDAQSNVESQVGSIITTLDPPDPASGSTPAWEYILDALTFGLSLYSEGTILVKAAIRSLPQSSSLITKVYPEGDVSGDVTSWAQVAGTVGQFCQTWAKDIASALPDVADDVPMFVAFAGAGQLTGGVTDLSSLTGAALGFIITRTAFVDVHLLQQNTSLQWDTGCGAGYDGGGYCGGNFFYDGLDTYSLVDPNKMQRDQTDVFNRLFEAKEEEV
ncbi:hypothetical protein PRZ48_003109 [Zasmidium cellare]|uniref:Uncharacterized protein n=1 Tax=Zasmidium cellare TaxID=395010 RepID=A0ABR0EVM5_ZASCE|nr:hypothetical protein PRZ48_003109 [Zasmidium cellare]